VKSTILTGTVSHIIHAGANGGAIFGFSLYPQTPSVRVVAEWHVFRDPPLAHEPWTLTGEWRRDKTYGLQFHPVHAEPWKPDGPALVRFLGRCSWFSAMQPRTARRLWAVLGPALSNALDSGDLRALRRGKVNLSLCKRLVDEWQHYWTFAHLRRALMHFGLHNSETKRIHAYWGDGAERVVQKDPYRLLPFVPWEALDQFALEQVGVSHDSNLRLVGASEEALIRAQRTGRYPYPAPNLLRFLTIRLGRRQAAIQSIEASIKANRIVRHATPSGDFYLSSGFEIVENAFCHRMVEFAQEPDAAHWAFRSPVLLVELFCTSTSKVIRALSGLAPQAYHIVPDSQMDPELQSVHDNGKFIPMSSLLIGSAQAPMVSQEVFIYGCQGLGLVVLNKLMQRLECGNAIRLVGFGHSWTLPDGPQLFETLKASGRFPALRLNTFEGPGRLGRLGDRPKNVSRRPLSSSMCAPVRNETVIGREALHLQTAFQFRKAIAGGRAVILTRSAREAKDWNIRFHGETIDFRTYSKLRTPVVKLHDGLPATLGEPVVCIRSSLERGIVAGMLGEITQIAQDDDTSHHSTNEESYANVRFHHAAELTLSRQEMRAFALAYAVRPTQSVLGFWDTVIMTYSDDFPGDVERLSVAQATASTEIVLISEQKIFMPSARSAAKPSDYLCPTLLAKLRWQTIFQGGPCETSIEE